MSDAYFLGLQEGSTKGESDARAGYLGFPIPPVSINLLDAGYSKGYEEGYNNGYTKTCLIIDERKARMKAERLAQAINDLENEQSQERDER